MTSKYFLQIALPSPIANYFEYLAPQDWQRHQLQAGMRVLVPFAHQKLVGVLLNTSDQASYDESKLKQPLELIDEQAILSPAIIKLCKWASDYYHHPLGEVIFNAMPTRLRQGKPALLPGELYWRLSKQAQCLTAKDFGRAQKQYELYQLLQQHNEGLTKQEIEQQGYSATLLNTLLKKQIVDNYFREVTLDIPEQVSQSQLQLNTEQQLAVSTITQHFNEFKPFLLHGITGSGKTEVYLRCIDEVIQQGKQALVLIPEIGLTPQTLQRFQQRFAVPTVVLHSNLSDGERARAWLQAQNNQAKIIIGTRSAIFTPLAKPGIIIIDEAHDQSFKQQDGFRYSARDLSVVRAHQENIPIVLGSATPSLESLYNCQHGRYQLLPLTERAGNAKPPEFTLIDVRDQAMQSGLSQQLLQLMQQHMEQGNQVLLFLNRRGYAPVLICHHCGWVANCKRCDAKMTLHLSPRYLHCHHCDSTRSVESHCPECNSDNLLPLGVGTERLETILQQQFPDQSIARIDRDSTRRKDAMQKMVDDIHANKYQLLIGTQMLAKGHHFPNVTLVAILDADSGLFSADFRSSERLAQLILQVAGRAGRANKPGQVAMQTRNPQHPLLQTLITKGYNEFATQLFQERQCAQLPPFSHLALFRAESTDPDKPQAFLHQVKQQIAGLPNKHINIMGPIASPMEKRAGRFRAQLMLQTNQRQALHQLLSQTKDAIKTIKVHRSVRWSLDVDPMEMF